MRWNRKRFAVSVCVLLAFVSDYVLHGMLGSRDWFGYYWCCCEYRTNSTDMSWCNASCSMRARLQYDDWIVILNFRTIRLWLHWPVDPITLIVSWRHHDFSHNIICRHTDHTELMLRSWDYVTLVFLFWTVFCETAGQICKTDHFVLPMLLICRAENSPGKKIQINF